MNYVIGFLRAPAIQGAVVSPATGVAAVPDRLSKTPEVARLSWGEPTAQMSLLRWLGALLLFDGLLLLVAGRAYVRQWWVGAAPSRYRRAIEWLARRPPWLLRLAGAAEAGLGLAALARAPVDVRSLYHAVAGVYDAASWLWRDWLDRDAHRAFDRALATHLLPGGQVLDLGCGTGANLERLLAQGLPFGCYTGVDLSEAMLARARAKFGHRANARFQQLDLLRDPLPEGPFDLVVSTYVFEHLPDPGRVVGKAWERLRPGGYVLLLFEVESETWRTRLLEPVWRFFSAHLLRQAEYRRFPGLVSAQRFAGPLTTAAVAMLHKPGRPG
ncbi:MAG: methyltransferase domain-containing protein [Chloroflexi bacterium]|nr:methyltransferase domain-containing protein [Chloroflexota bacterium]